MDSSFDYMFCAISTMSTAQQKAQTVLWQLEFESIIQVQCEFRYWVWRETTPYESLPNTMHTFITSPRLPSRMSFFTLSVSLNCLYHLLMLLWSGGLTPYPHLNSSSAWTTDSNFVYHKICAFCCRVDVLSHRTRNQSHQKDLIYFLETRYGYHITTGNPIYVLYNFLTSTIPTW
jgi:hypothetical protein